MKIPASCPTTVPPTSCPRVPLLLSFTPSNVEGSSPTFAPMPRLRALLTFPASVPSRHEPRTAHFRSPFFSHPLPSAQSSFPSSSRAASPSSTALLPRAKPRGTQRHRGVGGRPSLFLVTRLPRSSEGSLASRHFPRPLFSYSYELLFPQALYFQNHPHAPGCHPPTGPVKDFFRICVRCVSAVSYVFSLPCALFISLAALFRAPILCFQSFAHSLTKYRGVGTCGSRLLRDFFPCAPSRHRHRRLRLRFTLANRPARR
jgi:hypothetical protein